MSAAAAPLRRPAIGQSGKRRPGLEGVEPPGILKAEDENSYPFAVRQFLGATLRLDEILLVLPEQRALLNNAN
jgi:hypothetical protein